jgi:Reverse transcriptase (RNA-dependent DNA polymerase)
MRQPEGFKARGQENKVICLQRALYGLKQAGLTWWKELNSSINEWALNSWCLMLVSLSAKTLKRLLLPLFMSTMLCSLARTRLKSTPRRNSSWTNGNAVTWEKSKNFYACVSHEKKKIFILTSVIILTKC